MGFVLLVRTARSSTCLVVVMVFVEVLKQYPSWSSHLSRGSKKMMNMYGLMCLLGWCRS